MKQVILVRNDVNMSTGKLAAQCCHASVSAALESKKKSLQEWAGGGQKKIILQATFEEMVDAKKKCDKAKIISYLVSDAGLTELEPGTMTALGIGPDDEKKIDRITGSLKLLK